MLDTENTYTRKSIKALAFSLSTVIVFPIPIDSLSNVSSPDSNLNFDETNFPLNLNEM